MLFFLVPCFMLVSESSGIARQNKDTILFVNAHIYPVDDIFSTADAMVIANGRIVEIGTGRELLGRYGVAKIVDLKGKYVYPGFIDSHCHFLHYGLGLREVDLTGTTSIGQIMERLKEFQSHTRGRWLIGRGWDQNNWENKTYPNRWMLDSLFPDIPIYLTRIDGHAAWVNTAALKEAGINRQIKVKGGLVVLENGVPSGIFLDNAMNLVLRLIPSPDISAKTEALKKAQAQCCAVGLTMVCDAGLGYQDVVIIDSLQRKGELSIRVYAMLEPTNENFKNFISRGIYQTDRLSVRSIKLFADGALGSRGALLLEPYTDNPLSKGLQIEPTAYYRRICKKALRYGYQVNTHCIGDAANRMILDIYGEMLKGQNDLRWRIEHAQVVHPSDFHKFAEFSIIPSVQTTHATSDMFWAIDRLGEERIRYAYAYKMLLQQNGWLANGSDFPVEHINPLLGFYAAVARKNTLGQPSVGFQPENALTREEALRAMTIWAARAAFEETNRGSLEPGKWADFVVLDTDLMTAPLEQIPETQVLSTWIGGVPVYQWK
ncbi:MAG: amidohydrolase family protein [Bacteroidales bacterium]|nr:amidohydrolase family protein [Bacteroidales bacterium]